MGVSAIILAGGKGTRMGSDTPKPLQKIGKKTLLEWTLDKLDYLDLVQRIVVVGWRAEEIIKKTPEYVVNWAIQPKQMGNADALGYGLAKVSKETNTVIVLQADDSAFYKPETLKRFLESHRSQGATISLLTTEKIDKTPRYRVKQENGFYRGLIKLTPDERGIIPVEFFTGCACFEKDWLERRITAIPVSNEGELSIPALFEMAREENERVIVRKLGNPTEWMGINTREQLIEARNLARLKELG